MYTLIVEAVYVVILIFVFIGVQFVSVSVAVCAELTSIVWHVAETQKVIDSGKLWVPVLD